MIEVVNPGALSTVQNLGQFHEAHHAVSAGGAADPAALILGNRLVGNEPDAAALEMTMRGATLRFHLDTTIALTGAPFEANLDNQPLAHWQAHAVRAGQTLRLYSSSVGIRCYLAVAGGLRHPVNVALRATDRLSLGLPQRWPRAVAPEWIPKLGEQPVRLRITPGAQIDRFWAATRGLLTLAEYEVSPDSNRRGIRLEGPKLQASDTSELITEGVSVGAIQVPASGQPIILFVDQQTTGGYAKIASVISRDLHLLGQLRPRDRVRFEFVTLEEAKRLYREWHHDLFD